MSSWYQTKANPSPANWRQQGQLILTAGRKPAPATNNSKLVQCDHKREDILESKDYTQRYYDELYGE